MDLSQDLSLKLNSLKDKNGNPIELGNLDYLVQDLLLLFSKYSNSDKEDLYKEIKSIESKVHEAKSEITASMSKKDTVLACASSELDAVIESTEEATNKILDSAEHIQATVSNLSNKEMSDTITNDIMVIFEACNFQDITGQRIKKVTMALDFIEESVGHILEKYSFDDIKKDSRTDANLMEGPQSNDQTPDQGDIDKLFDNA